METPTSIDTAFSQLRSRFFPERERAVQRMQAEARAHGPAALCVPLLAALALEADGSWEARQGALLACAAVTRAITERATSSSDSSHALPAGWSAAVASAAVQALSHPEARVRTAAAALLEPLAAAPEAALDQLYALLQPQLQVLLERDDAAGADQGLGALSALVRGGQQRRAGWFVPHMSPALLGLLLPCARHRLAHVREAALQMFSVLADAAAESLRPHELSLARDCAVALGDPNVHVIMAGSQAVRALLRSGGDKDALLRELLPAMCLNRYYPAEGLRLYSMESWQQAVGTRGRELLATLLPQTVAYYLSKAGASHPNIREAATRCLHELLQKIDTNAVRTHVPAIVGQLLELLHDSAWPIRDAAFTAIALALTTFPAEVATHFEATYQEAIVGISDPLWCVRESAACQLVATLAAAPARDAQLARITAAISSGLDQLRNQPPQAQTHVKKYITPRDRTAVRSSGAQDSHHQPARVGQPCTHCEPWQLTDGCIYALRELSKVAPAAAVELIPAFARVADSRLEFDHAVPLHETVWTEFAIIARSLASQAAFRRQLGLFVEPLRSATKNAAPQVQSASMTAMRLMRELFKDEWLKLV